MSVTFLCIVDCGHTDRADYDATDQISLRREAHVDTAYGEYVQFVRTLALTPFGVPGLAGDRICAMTPFQSSALARFGLPRSLARR
jgi:hypothetical protein